MSDNSDLLGMPIDELAVMTVRSCKALDSLNIRTLGDLVACSDAKLLRLHNFGLRSLREVRDAQDAVLGNYDCENWSRKDITWLLRSRIEDYTDGWITLPIRHIRQAIEEIERLRDLTGDYPPRSA